MINNHYIALFAGIVLTAVAQVILKTGAKPGLGIAQLFFNFRVLTGYGLLFVVTILNIFALQEIELKVSTAWVSLTYLSVMALSVSLLKERVSRNQIVGCSLIVTGILVFSLG